MKPQSAKAKGRNLQKWVRDQILAAFPSLSERDVQSTSMGAGGADVKLSEAAFKRFPYSVECKSLASAAIYKHYDQAASHGSGEPVVFLKMNRRKPLAIVDAEYFFQLNKERFEQ